MSNFASSSNSASFQYSTNAGLTGVTGPTPPTNSPVFNGITYTLFTNSTIAYLTTTVLPKQKDFSSCICNYQFAGDGQINTVYFGPVSPGIYSISCYNNLTPTSSTYGQFTGILTAIPLNGSTTNMTAFVGGVKMGGWGVGGTSAGNGYMIYLPASTGSSTVPAYPAGLYLQAIVSVGTSITTLKITQIG